MKFSDQIARLVCLCAHRAWVVLLVALLLLGGSLAAAAWRLGVSTDTDALFANDLPWRQRDMAVKTAFPQFNNLLVAVIDGASPEQAEQTATDLAHALAADTTHFSLVRQPDASSYFDSHGMLLLDTADLASLLDSTVDAQPFLGQLSADPSARGLFAALALMALGVDKANADLTPFTAPLQAFHSALAAAAAGTPTPLSWQSLLAGKLSELGGRYRFVVAQPVLDYSALQPGGEAAARLRTAAAGLEFVRAGTAHVRLTGQIALADEEFATVAEGALVGTLASAALVVLWLWLAVRSWRMIVPIVATLVLGLALTTGFAALAVGTLNLVSVAFAILFVGIAVDFAIQFSVRYRQAVLEGGPDQAMAATAKLVGPQVVVAACASAAGFLAFVPTAFAGVAELGLIAGVGMLIALGCTLTLLPACLALLAPRGEAEMGLRLGGWAEPRLRRIRTPILAGFGALGLCGLLLLPRLAFDNDPLHTKDPTTEAVRTLYDLMDNPLTSPYAAEILAPSLDDAAGMAQKLRGLPGVGDVLTLHSFIPTDQPAKLALLQDARTLLAATLAPRTAAAPISAADLRLAAHAARMQIDAALPKLKPDAPLALIAADLAKLEQAPDDVLLAANTALTRFLPLQLARLRAGLAGGPTSADTIPDDIKRDWVTPDGRARVLALSTQAARTPVGLAAFATTIRDVAPEAAGAAIIIAQTAQTVVDAFRTAALGALAGIALLLLVVLRRLLDMALVLGSLLMSALLTVVLMMALALPLNFANIIALPLLLGVGVSFNIYFVMNWRAGADRFLGTATARAILYSALTTATAFGALALSPHPGTASMGTLLLLSLGSTLVVTLVFLPVLLRGLRRRQSGAR